MNKLDRYIQAYIYQNLTGEQKLSSSQGSISLIQTAGTVYFDVFNTDGEHMLKATAHIEGDCIQYVLDKNSTFMKDAQGDEQKVLSIVSKFFELAT